MVLASYQASKGVKMLSWDRVQQAGITDVQNVDLLHKVGTGSSDRMGDNAGYARYSGELSVVDRVVVFRGHVFVPREMQYEVLQALHTYSAPGLYQHGPQGS